jgi:hypothetical protein
MTIDENLWVADILKSLDSLPSEEKSLYQQIAGHNLGRLRNQHFPNKLSAMAATLQENRFRETLNPKDLERQLRRWISNGLPLENIESISEALNIPPSELLNTADLPPDLAQTAYRLFQTGIPSGILQDISKDNQKSAENGPSILAGGTRRKYVNGFGAVGIALIVLIVAIFWGGGYLAPESIAISWPDIVDTHSEYVSGNLENFSPKAYQDMSVKLFVKPADGDTKYWLNAPDYPPVVTEDGQWYQKCRFGDEDIRSMKKTPPLRFDLYAVALKTGVELPLDSMQNYFEAESEKAFLEKIAPYAAAVSDKFSLVRVESAEPEIPIVLAIAPSVKITWGENVPMYLEIYHGGQVISEGYFSSGDAHNLPPSQIPYEIKMGRKEGFHQSNTWILVENQ